MSFNSIRNGFQNEDDFVRIINNKKMYELDFGIQLFIEDLYDKISPFSTIHCRKNPLLQKSDIIITINGIEKYISIKKGYKNSVHIEPISEMIHFLVLEGMPKKLVINLLKYHYADGTTNGTGINRISVNDYKINHQYEIDEINKFINQKDILIKVVNRFVLQGRNSTQKIDALLYGVPSDFIWIKSENILKYLLLKKDEYSTAIHFSRLTYQPLDRCLNYNPMNEKKRYVSQIKWYNIGDDIIESIYLNKLIENNFLIDLFGILPKLTMWV